MIRKILIVMMFMLAAAGLSACGGGGGGNSNSSAVIPSDKLAFNLATETIPFPNDIAWATSNPAGLNQAGIVDLEGTTSDPSTNALYTEIANLKIKGLSPNTPIAIPLDANSSSELTNLNGNIVLIDLTQLLGPCEQYKTVSSAAYNGCLSKNLIGNSEVDQTARIKSFYQTVTDSSGKVLNYAIKIYPVTPLDAGDQYVVAVKKGIKSANGALLSATSTLDLLKSDSPLADPQMEAVRQQYAPLFDLFSQLFLTPKSDILELFTFTTADKTLSLADFANIATDPTSVTGLPYNPSTSNPESVTSEYEMINDGSALAAYSQVSTDVTSSFSSTPFFITGFNSFDIRTLSTSEPTPEAVPTIIIPSGHTDKVVIFQHGLGETKMDAFALAAKLLPAGYTIIAMDLPDHGARAASYAANPYNACDTSVPAACFFTANIPQDRVNLYQSAFDMTILLKDLKAGKFDLDGNTSTVDKPTKIYFVSQSLGSITGSVFNKFNNSDITKSVLNVGGANFAAILDETSIESLKSTVSALGYTKNSVPYMTFLGITQLLLDPADPVYLANGINNALVQTANGDIVVPNTSNEIFAKSVLGLSAPTMLDPAQDLSINSAVTDPVASWYQYGITGQYIPHGFMLTDDISSYNGTEIYPIYQKEQSMITNAYKTAQDQVLNYLNK